MDDNNNNQEMSVDELLEKLKNDFIGNDTDENGEKVVAEKDSVEEPVAEEPVAEEPVAEEPVAEEPVAEEPVADEPVAEATDEAPIDHLNEEDIFAAWGIDRAEVQSPAEKQTADTESAEPAYEAPTVTRTKVYYITHIEKKEDFAARKATETQKETVDYDRTDYSLIKQALGMEAPESGWEDGDKAQDFEVYEERKSSRIPHTIDSPKDEFTYQRQKDDISSDYKRWSRSSGIKLAVSGAVTFLLFLLECLPSFGIALPDAISIDYYPTVNIMVALQLLWITAALCYREIANGALGLIKLHITNGSILALAVLFTTIADIVVCIMGGGVPLFNFPTAICAFAVRLFDFWDIRRQNMAFEIASATESKKYVAVKVPSDEVRSDIDEEYAGDDSLVLRTEKCSFVENYFARTDKRNQAESDLNKILVPVVFAVAIISLIICIARGNTPASCTSTFNAALMVGLPIIILMSGSYPMFRAGQNLYRHESAIIGETAVDEYAGTTMICFDDADAFPSYGVSLENLRIFGKGDIETIIEQMGAVFSKLGGPLRHVFSLMTSDCPKPYKVKIDGVYEDGICAQVDGKTLFIGNASYMEENGFSISDKSEEIGGKHFSTMYLAQEGALHAKFYIRYTVDGSFESILKKLAKCGIASVVMTGDSNISDELLARSVDISKLPVKVVRRRGVESPLHGGRADSGIVSRGNVSDLVRAVTMCDRVSKATNTIKAIRIASTVICAVIMIFACVMNMSGTVSSLYAAIYQLFWIIPALIITRISI